MPRRNLPDLSVLIALTDPDHQFHREAHRWFVTEREIWGLCPFTEAGFIRITTNRTANGPLRSVDQSIAILQSLKAISGHMYWEINASWVDLTAPFVSRIQGHQQVTDACLLGLAIRENGVLVTFDRGLRYLAGRQFSKNLLVIE